MTIIPIRPRCRRRRRRRRRHRLLFFARRKVSDDTVLDFIPFFVFPQNFLDLRLPLALSERADGTNFEENVFTARRDESTEALSEGFKREYYYYQQQQQQHEQERVVVVFRRVRGVVKKCHGLSRGQRGSDDACSRQRGDPRVV